MKGIHYLSSAVVLALIVLVVVGLNRSSSPSGMPGDRERILGERSAFVSVMIEPAQLEPLVHDILVSPQEVTLFPGQEILITALAQGFNGEPVEDVDFQWKVMDPAAGAITPRGSFIAGSTVGGYPDVVEVSVFSGGQDIAGTASIAVVRQQRQGTGPLNRVELYPPDIVVRRGEVVRLSALGLDGQGRPVHDIELLWSMGDPKAGSIDEYGIFTASQQPGQYPSAVVTTGTQHVGQETIERQIAVSVTVRDDTRRGVLSRVEVVPASVVVTPGGEADFFARALDERGQPINDVWFTWRVTEPAAGRMDESGHFVAGGQTGKYSGAIRVTAAQQTPQGFEEAQALVTVSVVRPTPVGDLLLAELSPETVTLRPGQHLLFIASGLNSQGESVPVDASWEMSDAQAGSIDPSGLFIAGHEPGVYKDAVRVQLVGRAGGPGMIVGGYAAVNILGPLERLEVRPSTVGLRPGESIRLHAIGYDANGLEIPLRQPDWSIQDPPVGTIDQSGTFTAGATPGKYENAIRVTVRITLIAGAEEPS